ncbi:6-hydroxy-D-nicotine oxidase [Fusarium albosuccineum]|uniref:6-hydroxy-D-nicotine oxidase n=1 Tax=Fusarium albosuccineum TaxID=1237068 RepID=A0A8H4P670_9HYPO|nr:6-hydroxy-D-nicotine oxidase [Fusarium albosuccineum]
MLETMTHAAMTYFMTITKPGNTWLGKNTVSMTVMAWSLLSAVRKLIGPLTPRSSHHIIGVALWAGLATQAQDFRDQKGDLITGRQTLPLAFGDNLARYIVAFFFMPLISLFTYVKADHQTYVLVTYIFCIMVAMSSVVELGIASDDVSMELRGHHQEEVDKVDISYPSSPGTSSSHVSDPYYSLSELGVFKVGIMEVLAAGIAWAFNNSISPQKILGRLGLASLLVPNPVLWSDLSAKLSPQASIVLPNDSSFQSQISRWREWHAPHVGVVVNVFTETDVQETVRYANEHGLPFLARSGGHGATEALGLAKNVVIVDLRGWDSIDIAEDGKTATIGGGASVKKVVNTLWAAGKQTVTGICECVGVSAPILGGGHGWLQGEYGLASDQVVSARVVLPNGEVVTASEDTNSDLFWGLRGAGHNFGIVTEWQYRIHDVQNPKWSYEILIFLGDKLEQVLELTNRMMKTQPPELTHWMYIVNIPEIDPKHPIIWYAIIYDGPADKAREYAEPLRDIGPLNVDAGAVPMPDLAGLTMMSDESIGCAKGYTGLRYPIGLKTYDLPAVRRVFDEITETSRRTPELAGSFFLLEGYSTYGVKAVDEKASAFPHRDDEILVTSYIMYKPNASIDALAQEYGEKLRTHLLEASEEPKRLRAYVNYAHGVESLESMYGWEEWRLEKLRKLKQKWDPKNRMRFYNPIA